jgi:phosphoglycerate dehydrogenase-like enzyme
MKRTGVRVLTHMPPERLARIREAVPEVELVAVPTQGEPDAGIEGEVLLTLPWGTSNLATVVERGVRWVHAIGTGVDGFPFSALTGRVLTCSRGASAIPISEWVIAMMLAFEKRIPETWITEPPPAWNFAELGTLWRRTLGLVGIGSIGAAVAERALPFGMRICAIRRTAQPAPLPGVEVLPSLDDVLACADHLLIALPATPRTRRLIGADVFSRVKPGVHLINVARGSIVDQDALRAALDDGRVARASLDTVEPEPLPPGHWLYGHPRVRLSPHVSWGMPGAFDLFVDAFTTNLRRYLDGEPLLGVVDLAEGY